MTASWKPEGHSDVAPYLIVRSVDEVLKFLRATFGAETLRRFDREDGSAAHAEARIGDSVVMMGEAGGDWQPVQAHIHVYAADVDAAIERARSAGGEVVQEPVRKDGDSDRRGGVRGPAGNTWWIGTQQPAEP